MPSHLGGRKSGRKGGGRRGGNIIQKPLKRHKGFGSSLL